MDNRPSGIAHRCGPRPSRRARKIACPGRRRQRHSAGAGECARTQRLGQRSQRHRQRGQSACDPVADNHSGDAARRLPFCGLPRAAGAASGEDQTNAICGIEIAWLGGAGGRQGAGQAARPRGPKHLQGMLNSAKVVASNLSRLRGRSARSAGWGKATSASARVTPTPTLPRKREREPTSAEVSPRSAMIFRLKKLAAFSVRL
jgi:hypothetical protein